MALLALSWQVVLPLSWFIWSIFLSFLVLKPPSFYHWFIWQFSHWWKPAILSLPIGWIAPTIPLYFQISFLSCYLKGRLFRKSCSCFLLNFISYLLRLLLSRLIFSLFLNHSSRWTFSHKVLLLHWVLQLTITFFPTSEFCFCLTKLWDNTLPCLEILKYLFFQCSQIAYPYARILLLILKAW